MDAELVAMVGELSRSAGRPAQEAEVRAALATLSAGQEDVLRRLSPATPPAAPLGPMAWADIARGVPAKAAAARELSGYYTLLAERDALASLLQARSAPPPARQRAARATPPGPAAEAAEAPSTRPPKGSALLDAPFPRPPEAPASAAAPAPFALDAEAPAAPRSRAGTRPRRAGPRGKEAAVPGRAEEILGLFAYHRDAPRVARALGLSMAELEGEIDRHKLRRKTARLVNGRDVDLPRAVPLPGKSGPPVRRRAGSRGGSAGGAAKGAVAAPAPPPRAAQADEAQAARGEQSAALRALLRQVGPRRAALAARLGTASRPLPESVLLARFRAAGLEREFGQRERDLVRALLSRNRMALGPAAAELGVPLATFQALIAERGLLREVEAQREKQRERLRARVAARDRIDLVLRQRDWLQDLGLLEEMDREAAALVERELSRARQAGLKGARAVEALHAGLQVSLSDVRALLARYKLR